MRRVQLEVIAPTLQSLGLRSTCELVLGHSKAAEPAAKRVLDQYPPEWYEEYRRLVEYVHDLADRHGEQILIRVIDPQSPEGLLKSLRYRVRRYPTWVVEGQKRIVGWDSQALEAALAQFWDSAPVALRAHHRIGVHPRLDARCGTLASGIKRIRRLLRIVAEMIYGATIYDMVRELNKERGMLERLFVLAIFGDMLGVPILPPYYALRLLPYAVPQIKTWRYTMMRERDLTDLFDQEIG
jgi:hypothetical protein